MMKMILSDMKRGDVFQRTCLCLYVGWFLLISFMLALTLFVELFLILLGTIYALSSEVRNFADMENYTKKVDYFSDIFRSGVLDHLYAYADVYGAFFLFYAMVTVMFSIFTLKADATEMKFLLLKHDGKKIELALFIALVSLCLFLTWFLFIRVRDWALENILPCLLLFLITIVFNFLLHEKGKLFSNIIVPLFLFSSFMYGWMQGQSAWWGIQEIFNHSWSIFFLLLFFLMALTESCGGAQKLFEAITIKGIFIVFLGLLMFIIAAIVFILGP